MKKFLKVLFICLALFTAIDAFLYIAFDFKWIDALLELFGIKGGINEIPEWIRIVVVITLLPLIVKYDSICNYLFENEDQR